MTVYTSVKGVALLGAGGLYEFRRNVDMAVRLGVFTYAAVATEFTFKDGVALFRAGGLYVLLRIVGMTDGLGVALRVAIRAVSAGDGSIATLGAGGMKSYTLVSVAERADVTQLLLVASRTATALASALGTGRSDDVYPVCDAMACWSGVFTCVAVAAEFTFKDGVASLGAGGSVYVLTVRVIRLGYILGLAIITGAASSAPPSLALTGGSVNNDPFAKGVAESRCRFLKVYDLVAS